MIYKDSLDTPAEFKEERIGTAEIKKSIISPGTVFPHDIPEPIEFTSTAYFYQLNEYRLHEKSGKFFGEVWHPTGLMNNAPNEHYSHEVLLKDVRGDVLIGGLGIGLFFLYIKSYTHIDIVEKNFDIIKLIWPYFEEMPNCDIYCANMWDFKPKKTYDYFFADFFATNSHTEKYPEDEKERLEKKFSPFCKNIICWEL